MSRTIDRDSPAPYWEQLLDILRGRIRDGRYPIGERLPSELELGREFALSRATVRQALANLESTGFARRVPRRGVFASTPAEPSRWTIERGFLESQVRQGRTGITTRVLSHAHVVPPAHVAAALGLDDQERVLAIERVRSLDGVAFMASTNWLPGRAGDVVAATPSVLAGEGSVNATLAEHGFVAARERRVLNALGAPHDVAARLGLPAGAPLLRVRSSAHDAKGAAFDCYETWVLTDVMPLEVGISSDR